MDTALINAWNSTVSNEDEIYILGDVSLKGATLINELMPKLNGIKYLIKGNHDLYTQQQSFEHDLFVFIKDYYELNYQGQYFILSHYPFLSWNGMHRGSIHLHGHQHNKKEYNLANRNSGIKRYDVGVDANDMHLVSIENIICFFAD